MTVFGSYASPSFFMSIIKWQIKIFSSSAAMSKISLFSLCYKTKEPADRPGTVFKIKCLDYQATYSSETDKNLTTRLNGHKRVTKKGDFNNIAEHHKNTSHTIDWDLSFCFRFSVNISSFVHPSPRNAQIPPKRRN